jgi:hypothetical protein
MPLRQVRKYLENLWEEAQPETAERLREADANIRQREDLLRQINAEIEVRPVPLAAIDARLLYAPASHLWLDSGWVP